MAFPTWGAVGASAEGAAGVPATISPAWPAHVAGDIGVLVVVSGNYFIDVSNPQGFEEIHVSPRQAGLDGQTSAAMVRVYMKRAASAAEPAPTIVVPSTQVLALIFTIKDTHPTGRPWDEMAGRVETVAATAVTWPGMTVDTNETLIVGIMGHSNDSAAAQCSGYTNTSLTNLTERIDTSSVIGDGAGIVVWSGTRALPGSVLSTQATLAGASRQGLITIAFTQASLEIDDTPRIYKFGAPAERDTAGTISPAWPTDHVAGDVGILVVASGGWPLTFANQQGFTQFNASPQMAGVSGDANSSSLHVFWKRATSGAEAAPVINFIADHLRAFIFTVKGCAGDGFPVSRSQGNVSATPGTTGDFSTFSTVDPYQLMLAILSHSRESAGAETVDFVSPNIPFFSEQYDVGSNIGSGAGIAIGAGPRINPGQCDVSFTLAASHHSARILIALRPQSGMAIVANETTIPITGKQMRFDKSKRIVANETTIPITGKSMTFTKSSRRTVACQVGEIPLVGRSLERIKSLSNWTKDAVATNVWTKDTSI